LKGDLLAEHVGISFWIIIVIVDGRNGAKYICLMGNWQLVKALFV
jgi:hypothetical protein